MDFRLFFKYLNRDFVEATDDIEKNFLIKKSFSFENDYFCNAFFNMVDVAQLVRALDCGSKGRGFEPHLPPGF